MTKAKDNEVRELFTQIGCIMEDASLIALVWGTDGEWDVAARYREISAAHNKMGTSINCRF
jgi:hypothetical protein